MDQPTKFDRHRYLPGLVYHLFISLDTPSVFLSTVDTLLYPFYGIVTYDGGLDIDKLMFGSG